MIRSAMMAAGIPIFSASTLLTSSSKVLGNDNVVTDEDLAENVGAQPPRGHGRDDDVGVEEDPHEILAKMSSSVR